MKGKCSITEKLLLICFLALIISSSANAKSEDGVKNFHGKWWSARVGIPQTLKIRCDKETNFCKMRLVVEESRTCTEAFNELTAALLEAEKQQVQIVDHTIVFFVDAYCLTKPPSYSFSFEVSYTHNNENDTLTDNLGVTWYRK